MDDVAAVQHDSYNIPLANLAKEIVARNSASNETLASLRSWNGKMTPDSNAALITNEIRTCMANKMTEDNKPAPVFIIRERVLDSAVRDNAVRWLPKTFADYPRLMRS